MYFFCGHDDKFDVRNTCLLKLGTTSGQVLVLSMCQCYVGYIVVAWAFLYMELSGVESE